MIVSLWAAGWSAEEREGLLEHLLQHVPRLALSNDVIWADAHGLDAARVAQRLVVLGAQHGLHMQAGVASVPAVAEVAARTASSAPQCVALGEERAFLASRPIELLQIDDSRRLLLQGVGIETCGELAALEREAVEVRFGPELLLLWRRARGEEVRRLFERIPPEPLHAALDFVDYVVSDGEQLIFSVNALFGGICDDLRARGLHARSVKLRLSLANGGSWERVLRPARPTGSRTVWLRLARAVLERLTVPDAVSGIALVVLNTETASAVQGDLFDAGFATASAVEAALERLVESQGEVVAEVAPSAHALAEQRSNWQEKVLDGAVGFVSLGSSIVRADHRSQGDVASSQVSGLTLQLLPEPREVLVETVRRRDHESPVRYRDGEWVQLLTTAGPDRISGGHWDDAYAREYFRAVTTEGTLVWLFRNARNGNWYLHGWWD
jgi:protein ImuB